MVTKDEALKLALEALEAGKPMFDAYWGGSQFDNAIAAVKEALAQPEPCKYGQEPKSCTSTPMDCQCAIDAVLAQDEQEPMAKYIGECHEGSLIQLYEEVQKGTDFYTALPKEQPLTDEERIEIMERLGITVAGPASDAVDALIKEVEAAHGIKE